MSECACKKHTVQSKRTVVYTDGWRAHRGLGDTVRHRTVNHSRSGKYRFVTEESCRISSLVGEALSPKARKVVYEAERSREMHCPTYTLVQKNHVAGTSAIITSLSKIWAMPAEYKPPVTNK